MPPIEWARWLVAALFAGVLAIASVSDIRRRIIPNWTVVAVIVLFVPWIFVAQDVSVRSSLAAAGIAFAASLVFYAFGLLGAGDSKLFAAVALFVGVAKLAQFAIATTLAGGVLALIIVLSHPTRLLVMFRMRGRADFGHNVPYGVAIAVGALAVVFGRLSGALAG